MCNTTGSSTGPYIYWTLSPGSCPEKNDTILVIVGRYLNCQDDMHSPCGPFMQRNVPNWSQYPDPYTCSSVLTVPRNTSATIQCRGDELDSKSITIIRNYIPGNTTMTTTVSDTTVSMIWTPPTMGGVPTSYYISINSSYPIVIPANGSDGSLMYTYTGLESDTLYEVSLVIINCVGTSNATTAMIRTYVSNITYVMANVASINGDNEMGLRRSYTIGGFCSKCA
eukprot:Em0003g397a